MSPTITISRNRGTGQVTARSTEHFVGSHTLAGDLLQRDGFLPVQRRPGEETILRLPADITDPNAQRARVASTVATLQAMGYTVRVSPALRSPDTQPSIPEPRLGETVDEVGTRIATASTTREVSDALLEFTAPVTGILPAAASALVATADWWRWLGDWSEVYAVTERLDQIAALLRAHAEEVNLLRARLADRDIRHPYRGQQITAELPTAQAKTATDPRLASALTRSPRTAATPAARPSLPEPTAAPSTTAPRNSPPAPPKRT